MPIKVDLNGLLMAQDKTQKLKTLPPEITHAFLHTGRFFVINKTTSFAENGVLGHRGN